MDTGDGSLCELPVERFWTALRSGLQQALAKADATVEDIVALAYSSQANSFLLLDEKARPLTPLILWPDSRVEAVDKAVTQLWNRHDFLTTTGLGIECRPQLAAAKIRWFQANRPEVWSRTSHIMTISDYLTFSLTGKTVGDAGNRRPCLDCLTYSNCVGGKPRWTASAFLLNNCPHRSDREASAGTIDGAGGAMPWV